MQAKGSNAGSALIVLLEWTGWGRKCDNTASKQHSLTKGVYLY